MAVGFRADRPHLEKPYEALAYRRGWRERGIARYAYLGRFASREEAAAAVAAWRTRTEGEGT